jgi:hypothetical protein
METFFYQNPFLNNSYLLSEVCDFALIKNNLKLQLTLAKSQTYLTKVCCDKFGNIRGDPSLSMTMELRLQSVCSDKFGNIRGDPSLSMTMEIRLQSVCSDKFGNIRGDPSLRSG